VLLPGLSGLSEQSADLVDGLGLASVLAETGAAADQGTADDGTRPEEAAAPYQ
jgi:hypothetical protein